MMNTKHTCLVLLLASGVAAQEPDSPATAQKRSFVDAASSVQRQLEESLVELDQVRAQIAEEMIPLSRELNDLQAELNRVGLEFQEATRQLNTRTLDLANLGTEIKSRQDETTYLEGLFTDYVREFETRLHVTELSRYEEQMQTARRAVESGNASKAELLTAQTELVAASIERLHDAVGGTSFAGRAIGPDGLVVEGTVVLVGPAAVFRSKDGRVIGAAEQRIGSLAPAAIPFSKPENAVAAAQLVETGAGTMPLDPTLGDANKLEATQETFWEEVQSGGPVMWPIFVLAAAALLVALAKWLSLSLVRKPSQRRIGALLDAVARRDEDSANECAAAIRGPTGRMLRAGVDHLREPRELIEEVMYETVLTTRLRLQRLLPFVGVAAASAPLLGLLGTVTGIMTTFKLITVYGSGDVKMLSSGISEALITTKYGLIVAIPSLLLHAYLTRKARAIVGQMETTAVAFVNQVSKTPLRPVTIARPGETAGLSVPDQEMVRVQVREILGEMLGPLAGDAVDDEPTPTTMARSPRPAGWSGTSGAGGKTGLPMTAPQRAASE